MRKIIGWSLNVALLLGIVVGLIKLRYAFDEYDDLRTIYSAIEVRDFAPGKEGDQIYIRCMVSKPLDLRWQYSLPAGVEFQYMGQFPMHGTVSTIGSSRSGARVVGNCYMRLKIDQPGVSRVKSDTGKSTAEGGFDAKVFQYLKDNWGELDVQVAGDEGTESFGAGEFIRLMEINVPDDVLKRSKSVLGDSLSKTLETPIFVCIGPEDSQEWATLELNPILSSYFARRRR
ncbi:MAG TPA: hypothetical protein DDW52_05535 [Planctomycetaceae bacterium]|nr:hypothetical protein [Planctomycetaceae bacterium]